MSKFDEVTKAIEDHMVNVLGYRIVIDSLGVKRLFRPDGSLAITATPKDMVMDARQSEAERC
jgi:hypothetical protein